MRGSEDHQVNTVFILNVFCYYCDQTCILRVHPEDSEKAAHSNDTEHGPTLKVLYKRFREYPKSLHHRLKLVYTRVPVQSTGPSGLHKRHGINAERSGADIFPDLDMNELDDAATGRSCLLQALVDAVDVPDAWSFEFLTSLRCL